MHYQGYSWLNSWDINNCLLELSLKYQCVILELRSQDIRSGELGNKARLLSEESLGTRLTETLFKRCYSTFIYM